MNMSRMVTKCIQCGDQCRYPIFIGLAFILMGMIIHRPTQ